MAAQSEPRNPFYLLLLLVGLTFIVTVLAYAVIPVLEQKAMDAGEMPPPSPFRKSLRDDGWKWVLAEVAALVALGLASMGLDRWRRWQAERQSVDATKLEPPPPG
jgi:hypothetical protein